MDFSKYNTAFRIYNVLQILMIDNNIVLFFMSFYYFGIALGSSTCAGPFSLDWNCRFRHTFFEIEVAHEKETKKLQLKQKVLNVIKLLISRYQMILLYNGIKFDIWRRCYGKPALATVTQSRPRSDSNPPAPGAKDSEAESRIGRVDRGMHTQHCTRGIGRDTDAPKVLRAGSEVPGLR